MKEYGELEKQMKKALTDIEKREKHLSISEQEVKQRFIFLLIVMTYSHSSRFNVCK